MKIAFSPIYKYQLPANHRFPMLKYELLPEQLTYEGIVEENAFFHPDQLTKSEILTTHTVEYLDKLNSQNLSYKEARKIGFPMRSELVERGKYIAKGTYLCAKYALDQGVALNIAGGTHHAYPDHGEGFCVFNDIAIASNLLLNRKEVQQILVIDLDVHQGNGTAFIFQNDPRVFTYSMHGAKNYPGKKERSDLDMGLADGTEDDVYLAVLNSQLPFILDTVRPDFVFYLSGVDVIESDKLGRLALSISGCEERDRIVFEACYERNLPVAVSMGGGYSERISTIVNAHTNTFRMAKEVYF